MWIRSILTETLAAAVVLLPIFLLLWKIRFHSFTKTLWYLVFALYLSAVYYLVGMPTILFLRFDVNLNLIPFSGLVADLQNAVKNVALFVPLGFLLPLLWKQYASAKQTIRFGFAMSLAIELLQLLTLRATDINDVLTNTLGTVIGYVLFYAAAKALPGIRQLLRRKNEVFFLLLIVVLVMFFVQPMLVNFYYGIL